MAYPSDFTPPTRMDDQPDLGEIKINHDVIASIVRLAAQQVPGVAAVGGGFVDGISELLSKREADKRGVKVTEDAHGAYAIEIRIIVTFGSEIGRTAYAVQVATRKQIIAMTDKAVARVDVIVEGVRLPGSGSSTGADRPDDLWAGITTTD
jgi:uncharacterized alkaline shock family protein YloU